MKHKEKKLVVKLGKRLINKGKQYSLYLDFPLDGKRERKNLKLYLYASPNTAEEREENRKNENIAERMRALRQIEINNGKAGLISDHVLKGDFVKFFKNFTDGKLDNGELKSTAYYKSAYEHFNIFADGKVITFKKINADLILKYRSHLLTEANALKSQNQLSRNSAKLYFNCFKEGLSHALVKGKFLKNPIYDIDKTKDRNISKEDTFKEHLLTGEIRLLVKTKCDDPVLKRAFLFSCQAGLRWSDISRLKYSNFRKDFNGNPQVVFRAKKSERIEYLYIPEETKRLIGEGKPDEKVFALTYNTAMLKRLQKWVDDAGIQKKITFHCARHSYAVNLVCSGVDVLTVSKLLGHADMKTTLIYVKSIDSQRLEAINRIPSIFE